jgi:hypothetical protein
VYPRHKRPTENKKQNKILKMMPVVLAKVIPSQPLVECDKGVDVPEGSENDRNADGDIIDELNPGDDYIGGAEMVGFGPEYIGDDDEPEPFACDSLDDGEEIVEIPRKAKKSQCCCIS